MVAIINYLRSYWKSLSFFIAVVFFLMDMERLVGNIGYVLYYPLVIVLAVYCMLNKERTSFIYILYIGVCFLSVVLNDIPTFYSIEFRFLAFVLVLLAFSPLVNGRSVALLRLRLLYFVTLLSVVLVFLNFIIFQMGGVSERLMQIYHRTGVYFGTTANNEFATLGAISTMYIITFLVPFFKKLRIWEFGVFLVLLFCCITMMLIASSRTALIGTIVSIVLVAVYASKDNLKQLPVVMAALTVFFVMAFFVFSDNMRGIIEYKQAGDISNVNVKSRESMWETRLDEFKSSPLYGIGFATISNPTKYSQSAGGVIEAGSGWLSVLSQTGILGGVCIIYMLIPNILFLWKNKERSYCFIWLVGLGAIFLVSPISEAYITSVGAVLCCLFWLTISVVDSFRAGLLKSRDLDPFLELRKKAYLNKIKDAVRCRSLHAKH